MPMKTNLYPDNWKQIATDVKDTAGWKFEQCGRVCRKPGETLAQFTTRYVAIVAYGDELPPVTWSPEPGAFERHETEIHAHPQRFTLTAAHLDHDPENPDARLAAMCAPCHLRYDAPRKAAERRAKKREGQLGFGFSEKDKVTA